MHDEQVSLWMEERRTDYMEFGFFALLLEHIPLLGLIFSVSNQIGAAMWAHDLEKRQHKFQRGELTPMHADAETNVVPEQVAPVPPQKPVVQPAATEVKRRVPPPPPPR